MSSAVLVPPAAPNENSGGNGVLSVLCSRSQLVTLLILSLSLPFHIALVWPHLFPAAIAHRPVFSRLRLAADATFFALLLGPLIRLCVPTLRQKLKMSYRVKFLGWKLALPFTALVAVYQCVALIAPFAQRKSDVEEAYLWHTSGFGHELDGTYACSQFLRDRALVGGILALLVLVTFCTVGLIVIRRNEPAVVWTFSAIASVFNIVASPLVLVLEYRLLSHAYCGETSLLARGAWHSASQGFVAMAAFLSAIQLPLVLFGFMFHRYPAIARAQASYLGGLGSSIIAALLFVVSVALLCLRETLSLVSVERARQLENQYLCHPEVTHTAAVNLEQATGSGGFGLVHDDLATSFVVPLAIQGALILFVMKVLVSKIFNSNSQSSKPLSLPHSYVPCRLSWTSTTTHVIIASSLASLCGWWCIDTSFQAATRHPNVRCGALVVAPLGWFLLTHFIGSIFVLAVAEAVLVVHEDDLAESSEQLAVKADV